MPPPPYKLKVISNKKLRNPVIIPDRVFFIGDELNENNEITYKVKTPAGTLATATISKEDLIKQFGEEKYNEFQQALTHKDTDHHLSHQFFRGLLQIAVKRKHVENPVPVPIIRLSEVMKAHYLTEGNTFESLDQKSARICQLIEEQEEEKKEEFINEYTRLYTPIVYAVMMGSLKIVQTLLKNDAKIIPRGYIGNGNIVKEIIESWKLSPTNTISDKHKIQALINLQCYIFERQDESDLPWFKAVFNKMYLFFKPDANYLPERITKSIGFNDQQGFVKDVKEIKLTLAKALRNAACNRDDPQTSLQTWLDNLDNSPNKDRDIKFLTEGRLGELYRAILQTYQITSLSPPLSPSILTFKIT